MSLIPKRMAVVVTTATLVGLAALAPAGACLTRAGSIEATVESLGPNLGGLEQMRVHISGFAIDEVPAGLNCAIALGVESEIVGGPLWILPRRVIPIDLAVVDVTDGIERSIFKINPDLNLDFNLETIGMRYFDWPSPVAFPPLSLSHSALQQGLMPVGEAILIFDLIAKPGVTVDEVIDDLTEFGHVARDYFVEFAGVQYLLWAGPPMLWPIDEVVAP